ncbi:MAG: type II toxin-antitoxin system Phd/YefM family antitoxin [Tistlia sp.]|uniref:type II toxin-antitoxin system Phd/YefM family antitoxin n=1 Tax=Tistlia sp. TaxID=3057121 RepID=UPI0034A46694
MAETLTIPASKFARNFGAYRDEALGGRIVKVTSHGRIVGAYLSASEFAHFEELKRRQREILTVGELPDDVVADLEKAEYGAGPR